MIYTVYLNPTIDKTVYLDSLLVGGTNRPIRVLTQGGGKALNVSTVLQALRVPNEIMGMVYEENGSYILNDIAERGIKHDFISVPGKYARVNTKIFDYEKAEVTEINESGPEMTADNLVRFERMLTDKVTAEDIVVLTGSLPPGCKSDYYAYLMDILPCPCVLDTSGAALKHGVRQSPLLIKPNLTELEALVGEKLEGIQDILDACYELIRGGVMLIAVSLGGKGALITDGKESYRALPMKVRVDSTVGAGDSMVAGILYALHNKRDTEEALRAGTAAAVASVTLPGTNLATDKLFNEIYPRVEIVRL